MSFEPISLSKIPGSFLRASVDLHYVTIQGVSTKVVMLTSDARALMHWLEECLPAAEDHMVRFKEYETLSRQRSMSALRQLRRAA